MLEIGREFLSVKVPTGSGQAMAPAIGPVPLREILALVPIDEYLSRLDKGLKGSACPRAEERTMLRNRLLILLGGCVLAASAVRAGDVGYINCSNHQEDTQVFEKARSSREVVTSLPCGERFTILLYGFIFSRIQTSDGKIGYVFSNLISIDHSAASVQQPVSARRSAPTSNVLRTSATVAKPVPAAFVQPQPTPAERAPAQAPAPTSNVPETTATVAQPDPPALAQPQPTPAEPAPAQAPAPTSNVPETTAMVAQPDPPALTQPQPAPAPQPAAPAIQAARARPSWEKPNPSVRRSPLVEIFGGYAFARLDGGGGTGSNLNGVLGSFGWNVRPWLQIVADSSYSVVTANGTKNVLYGNHYGTRFFHRGRNRWSATPFVEALVGGSRADTTVGGTGGYTTSDSSISMKAGGGLDINPSRRVKIRLFDVDYYRTSFGLNVHQNNYWVSTGIVLRLFGGGSE